MIHNLLLTYGPAEQGASSAALAAALPPQLAPTVEELVECAEDLAETFASLTGERTCREAAATPLVHVSH